MVGIYLERYAIRKSSTYSDDMRFSEMEFTILLILMLKRVGERILPWGTPFS